MLHSNYRCIPRYLFSVLVHFFATQSFLQLCYSAIRLPAFSSHLFLRHVPRIIHLGIFNVTRIMPISDSSSVLAISGGVDAIPSYSEAPIPAVRRVGRRSSNVCAHLLALETFPLPWKISSVTIQREDF